MSVYLKLLSTDHCSLCDEALTMLFSMPELAGLELRVVDVAQDDDLLERYGERVPVLQLFGSPETEPDPPTDTQALQCELGWPFTPKSIETALRSL